MTLLDIRFRLRCVGDEDLLLEPVRPGPGDDVILGRSPVNGLNFEISTSSPVLDAELSLRKSVAADDATAAAAAFDFVTNADNTSDVSDVFDSSSMSAAASPSAASPSASPSAASASPSVKNNFRYICKLYVL